MRVSYFDSTIGAKPRREVPLIDILTGIKEDPVYKSGVFHLRSSEGNNRDAIKKSLPAFTQSGTFLPTRAKKNIVHYNGVIPVDIDKVENPAEIRNLFRNIPSVITAFITCSGNGVCVLIQTDNTQPENHTECCKQVWQWIERAVSVSVQIDTSSSDVSRLRIISHDPDMFINENPIPFCYVTPPATEKKQKSNAKKVVKTKYVFNEVIAAIIEKTKTHPKSNNGRNEWVFAFSCESKKAGIPETDVLNYCLTLVAPDFSEQEIRRTVKSAFDNENIPTGVYIFENGLLQKEISNTGDNLGYLISKHYTLRKNIIKDKLEYAVGNDWEPFTDTELNTLWLKLPKSEKIGYRDFLSYLGSLFIEQVNPVKEYFDSLPAWDGVDHLTAWFSVIETPVSQASEWFKKFYVGSWAQFLGIRIRPESGSDVPETEYRKAENQTMLILQGSQGCGKSTFLKNLLPYKLKKYLTEKPFNPDDKDDKIMLSKFLFFIWDELHAFNKKEATAVKNAVTLGDQDIRKAYGHYDQNYQRRASLCGSTNENTFLVDKTGNRRFLIIPIHGLIDNAKNKQSVFPQLLAQVKFLIDSGYQYWFNKTEETYINDSNESFLEEDPINSAILKLFEPDPNGTMLFAEIIKTLMLYLPGFRMSPKKIGEALTLLGIENKIKKINGKAAKIYYIKNSESYNDIIIEDIIEPLQKVQTLPDDESDLPF